MPCDILNPRPTPLSTAPNPEPLTTGNMEFSQTQEKPTLLTLPIETRFMIYDSLVAYTGTLVVFAHYELTRNVDRQTIDLLHVNRLIRSEVQDFFYKNQKFQFRSFRAMENFLDKIGPYHTSLIRNLELGSWLAQRSTFADQITLLLKRLAGVDHLTILAPAHGFVTDWSGDAELGEKALAILRASKKLAAGRLYLAWNLPHSPAAIRFVPKSVKCPLEETSSAESTPKGYSWASWNDPRFIAQYVEVNFVDYLGTGQDERAISDSE